MIRHIARLALALWAAITVAGTLWVLGTHPLAQPVVARTDEAIRARLERAMAHEVTPEWLSPRMNDALSAGDTDRVALLLDIARDHGVVPAEPQASQAAALIEQHDGMIATAQTCAHCMIDIRTCPSLAMIGACAIPFELSPAGDVNALIRQGRAGWEGEDIDGIEAGLAGLGLAATVAALPSLGGSLALKAGATTLRVARRADALSPGLIRALDDARIGADTARLGAAMADAGRIVRSTSAAQALPILRLADNTDDLARLARLSSAAGPETRKSLEVLGKARSLRVLDRLADGVVMLLGLMLTLAAQIAALAGAGVKLLLRRALRAPSPLPRQ